MYKLKIEDSLEELLLLSADHNPALHKDLTFDLWKGRIRESMMAAHGPKVALVRIMQKKHEYRVLADCDYSAGKLVIAPMSPSVSIVAANQILPKSCVNLGRIGTLGGVNYVGYISSKWVVAGSGPAPSGCQTRQVSQFMPAYWTVRHATPASEMIVNMQISHIDTDLNVKAAGKSFDKWTLAIPVLTNTTAVAAGDELVLPSLPVVEKVTTLKPLNDVLAEEPHIPDSSDEEGGQPVKKRRLTKQPPTCGTAPAPKKGKDKGTGKGKGANKIPK